MNKTISIPQAQAFLNRGLSLNKELLLIEELDTTCFPKNKENIKCFLFILCTNGNLICEIDHKCYNIKKNDILLLFKQNKITDDFFPSDDFKGTALLADFTYYEDGNESEIAREVSKSHSFTICESSVAELNNLLISIKNELLQSYNQRRITSLFFAKTFICHIFEKRPSYNYQKTEISTSHQKECERFLNLINKHILKYHYTNFYSKLMGISYTQLRKCVKIAMNTTPQHAINQILIKNICQTITNNRNIKLKELITMFNFKSETTLCRFFKREMGKTISQFLYEIIVLQSHKDSDTILDQTSQ